MTEIEEFTLEELFQADTKKTLITTAGLLGIRMNQNQRKAKIAGRMALALLAFPRQLLQHLPFREVLKLQQMVHAKDYTVSENPSFIMDCIEQIGLTDTRFDGIKHLNLIYPDLLLPNVQLAKFC